MDTEKIIAELDGIYGKGKGLEIYTTIMPGIIADFTGILNKARPGAVIKEEYGLEDKKAVVYVRGTKQKTGLTDISIEIKKYNLRTD